MKEIPVPATIAVDLSVHADYALSKAKFAFSNSGRVPAAAYRRDEAALRATRPESLRIDIGWGVPRQSDQKAPLTGPELTPDVTALDEIGAFLTRIGVRPYWSYCYVPSPYRRELAEDPTGWVDMVTRYVAGARERGTVFGYHEVCHKPDLRDEHTGEAISIIGSLDDYLRLYRHAAPAVRRTDPSTPVGGPGLASVLRNEHWIPAFLDTVRRESLPLDFLSFHHLGTHSLAAAVDTVLSFLDDRPDLAEVEAHLNEYHSFAGGHPRGGPQDSHHLAATMLADFDRLLAIPAVTKVSWAQFSDSGDGICSGMVDIDGNRKPVLTAYEFFQSMPVGRRRLTVNGPAGVGGFAATDNGRAAVLLWNRATQPVDAGVDIAGWSGTSAGTVRRIDADHDGMTVERLGSHRGWTVRLPRGGVVLLELGKAGVPPDPAATVTRVRQRYPQRRATAWGDFDEATTTFRVGTADDPYAVPTVTAELTGCRQRMAVDARITGPRRGGLLMLRLDGPAAAVELRFDSAEPEPATVNLDMLGGGAAITASLTLRDAAAHTFATVRLS